MKIWPMTAEVFGQSQLSKTKTKIIIDIPLNLNHFFQTGQAIIYSAVH